MRPVRIAVCRAVAVLTLCVLTAATAPGCGSGAAAPGEETAQEQHWLPGVLPTKAEIQQAADRLAGESGERLASVPETIPCAKAGVDGVVGYMVQTDRSEPSTSTSGPLLMFEYRQGEWKRLEAAAPCLSCHEVPPITPSE